MAYAAQLEIPCTWCLYALAGGHFLIRRAKFSYLDNQKVSEKIQHMAEKLSLRYVEIRGLF